VVYAAIVNGLRIELLPDIPDEHSTTVRVTGEIDISSAGALYDALLIACEPDRRVVVDMDQVGFIDSSGISVLINVEKEQSPVHRGLVIQHPSMNVRRILGILGLLHTFGLDESEPESLTA
jgi:anti-sigma B factor antagonist